MKIRTKLSALEKRMQVGDLKRHCPLCIRRPGEIVFLEYPGQEVPPGKGPPCALCDKRPVQVVILNPPPE